MSDQVSVAKSTQLSTDLGEEVVILNLVDEVYYGLDGVGARIWSLLGEPRTLNEVADVIASEYEVDRDQCAADMLTLIADLAERSLVQVTPTPE